EPGDRGALGVRGKSGLAVTADRQRPHTTLPPVTPARDALPVKYSDDLVVDSRNRGTRAVRANADPPARDQPPATAGSTETRAPAGTGVSRPCANLTSSSPTYTLTNLRKLPESSTIRPASPGYAASRLAMTSRRVPGSALTSAEPPV